MLGLTVTNRVPFLKYDAAAVQKKRANGPSSVKSTDDLLGKTERTRLTANALDIARNYAIAAWAVRKHLDFVSTFSFQAQTDSDALNDDLEGLIEFASRPLNFDVRGTHSRQQFLRLCEAQRCTVGDVFAVKLGSGQLQGIESDRVRDPDDRKNTDNWTHGVLVSPAGRPRSYAIHRRNSGGRYEFERRVPARNIIALGYFDRIDQVRGVGLIVSGINTLRDTYENFDYALAKAKVSQLFALKVTSSADSGFGVHTQTSAGSDSSDATIQDNTYDVDFGSGPIKIEMEPGDDAEFLESATPSTQFKDFNQAMIGVALKALDIPFSFYDESFTNFFGARNAKLDYLQACKWKRRGLCEFLTNWTIWRLQRFVATGALVLPAGQTIDGILRRCSWVPDGVPPFRPLEDMKADALAVAENIKTKNDITMERYGRTYRQTLRIRQKEQQDEAEFGIQSTTTQGGDGVELGEV